MLKDVKCPVCGSKDILFEARVIVRFDVDEANIVNLISEYQDIDKSINRQKNFTCECQECYELFNYTKKNKE